jgi:hypothetical protein
MSTECRIGVQNEDGSILSIYCHSDGFPAGVGAILFDFYDSEEMVRRLLILGDLFELGAVIGDSIPFEERGRRPSPRGSEWFDLPVQCNAYCRDRGDKGAEAMLSEGWESLKREMIKAFGPDHLYLWRSGEWWWCHYPFQYADMKPLAEVLEEMMEAVARGEGCSGP